MWQTQRVVVGVILGLQSGEREGGEQISWQEPNTGAESRRRRRPKTAANALELASCRVDQAKTWQNKNCGHLRFPD
jgi:hypothetical protein